MSLSLLGSNLNEIPLVSELVPFPKSYDVRTHAIWPVWLAHTIFFQVQEAVLSALGAFPKHLPLRTAKSSIVLMYPCKRLNGTMYWAGLRAARESPEIWMSCMSCVVDGGCIPEVGFFIIDNQDPASPSEDAIAGDNGIHFGLSFPSSLRWLGGAAPSRIFSPPTHRVRPDFE